MHWLNIHTSTLDSSEFICSSGVQRSTWLCILRFCVGQENGGRIVGALNWSDRQWQQLVRVTLRDVRSTCDLWRFDGDDLEVNFYPSDKEKEVRAKAQAGRETAAKRWGKRDSSPDSSAINSADAEGKGRERKGKERNSTPLPPEGEAEVGKESAELPLIAPVTPPAPSAESAPKRKRAPKPGYAFTTDFPEAFAARLVAIGLLKGRQASTPWAPTEVEAVRAACLDRLSDEDFAAQLAPMRKYYLAAIPREKDFRRTDLGTLLNHWSGELDRARAYARDNDDGIARY